MSIRNRVEASKQKQELEITRGRRHDHQSMQKTKKFFLPVFTAAIELKAEYKNVKGLNFYISPMRVEVIEFLDDKELYQVLKDKKDWKMEWESRTRIKLYTLFLNSDHLHEIYITEGYDNLGRNFDNDFILENPEEAVKNLIDFVAEKLLKHDI
jgi:hypothetical protein